jgi:rhodanese-related sulfurtransferase
MFDQTAKAKRRNTNNINRGALTMKISAWLVLACATLLSPYAIAEEGEQGATLFQKHGCTNCHGANGVHPTSKYAPVLKGRPADYLYEKSKLIFSGESLSNNTSFMHEQFCIGEAPEEGCYPVPSDESLKHIAVWLSSDIPDKKKTPQGLYLSAKAAYDELQDLGEETLFIDVRTRAELAFVGAPTNIDANIPYMKLDGYADWDEKKNNFKMYPNSEFTMLVEDLVKKRNLNKDTPIILICRSGSRSARSAKLLHQAGYNNVYSVVDGFEGDKAKEGPHKGVRVVNGWKNSGLPWSYKLEKQAMYWELN